MYRNLTNLRHKTLANQAGLWNVLRRSYRTLLKVTPRWTVSKRIGMYGPFRLDRYFAFSNFEAWGSGHNRGFQACIEDSRDKRCVLDIGAHIGLVSLPISTVLAQGGFIYAFEPSEVNNHLLKTHLADNQINNVRLFPYLIGASSKEDVPFFEDDKPSGLPSIAQMQSHNNFRRTYKRQITLDEFCSEQQIRPEIIKIDVEGAELDVLEGGSNILQECHPIIYLSVHPNHIKQLGRTIEEMVQLVDKLGYEFTSISGEPVTQFKRDEYRLKPKSENK